MRTRAWGVLVLCSALLCLALVGSVHAGGEGRFEGVLKDLVGALDKLTTTLGGIRDEDSAKAAQPELRKMAVQWQALMKKAEDVAPPTKEEKDRLEKAYATKLTEARKKLFGEVERVREVAGGPQALKEISGVLARKSKK
ncbi:MAG: hypothetical protein HY040_02150 [Planctomycetes bacterium]|nr:hypothetical protein [Planctomycetota bacterium]